jgi:AAA domain/RepB DNA-primase from phage plasmid
LKVVTLNLAQAKVSDPLDPIRTHCEMLHSLAEGIDGVLVVSSYNVAGGNGTITHHKVGAIDHMVDAIAAHSGTPGNNTYVGLHVMRRALERGKRGGKDDIVAVLGLVADHDADTGKTGDDPCEPSYVIETSPGNKQSAWLFDKPLTVADAAPLAAALQRATGSDSGTADVAHVWRVPATTNWPNEAKKDRGRAGPAPVRYLREWHGDLTNVDAFREALVPWWSAPASEAKPIELGELPNVDGIAVSAEIAAMLAANDVGDRSKYAAKVVEKLAFDGHSAEAAAALFLSATGDWFARYDNKDARKDFATMWGKFGAKHADVRDHGAKLTAALTAMVPGEPANDNIPSTEKKDRYPGIISSGDFVRGFVPPDYLIDGIIQSGFLYSITGQTGAGKTAVALLMAGCMAMGTPLSGREVMKRRVLYFAGENPDDVRMRWIGLCHELGLDPDVVDVHFIEGVFSIPEFGERIARDVTVLGGVGNIFVDTTAAYFPGTDENSNVEMGAYARLLRSLTRMESRPTLIAASHPIKNATEGNLLPRGGGAFLNEMDGNLSLAKKGDRMSELHWQGKFRGPEFRPITFGLPSITVPTLVDSRGRQIPTVRARVIEDSEIAAQAAESTRDDQEMLVAIRANGARSLRDLAEALGWGDDDIAKRRAQTVTDRLKRSQFIIFEMGAWKMTGKGEKAVAEAARTVHAARTAQSNAENVASSGRRKRTGNSYRSAKDGTIH